MDRAKVPIARLKKDHAELRALIQAMLDLLAESPMRKKESFAQLFEQFIIKLRSHLHLEDETLYPELLVHEDSQIKNVAARFLSGTRTVNRFFNEYLKNWQSQNLKIDQEFLRQTHELFNFLEKRIAAEEKEFFSVVERKTNL